MHPASAVAAAGRKDPMDEERLHELRKRLHALKGELRSIERSGDEAAATVELDQARVGRLSRMDALQGQAMSQELKRRREIELQRIDSALHRLDGGNYGFCVRCEEEIDERRLQLDPAATLCIVCAEAADRAR